MVDWRDCPGLEYVPGRKGGQATFIGRRIPARALADWLSTGRTLEDFSDTFKINIGTVNAVYRYMTDDLPVGTVDLAGCASVEIDSWGSPAFKGSGFPVEALFDFLKAGRTARDFSVTYDVDCEHVKAVLRHAADQNYQGPLK